MRLCVEPLHTSISATCMLNIRARPKVPIRCRDTGVRRGKYVVRAKSVGRDKCVGKECRVGQKYRAGQMCRAGLMCGDQRGRSVGAKVHGGANVYGLKCRPGQMCMAGQLFEDKSVWRGKCIEMINV